MNTRHRLGWTSILLLSTIALGGCGFFGDDSSAPEPGAVDYPVNTGVRQTMDLMRGTASVYDIYTVNPNQGFLPGGEQIHLSGFFPDIAGAESIYTVYFGFNPAVYAPIASAFSIYDIYVVAPPGDALGFVDVNLFEAAAIYSVYTIYEPNGYEYIDPFQVTAVDPVLGPIQGGNDASVIGFFPVGSTISDIASAASAYTVYFGSEIASFRQAAAIDPVITSTRMYVTVPPKPDGLPGFVDVMVRSSDIYNTYRTLPDGYQYVNDFQLFDVIPSSGPFGGGYSARLNGNFEAILSPITNFAAASSAYTIYFGSQRAVFDAAAVSLATSTDMYVVVPRALALGTVDVRIFSTIASVYNTYLNNTDDDFTYTQVMRIDRVVPPEGPLVGGNTVRIEGFFPVSSDITSLAVANSIYQVYIDNNLAPFDTLVIPLISTTFLSIYGEYNVLNVTAPAGSTLGLVDVQVVDVPFTDPPVTRVDGYKYIESDTFGNWIDADVFPNPVGPLRAGELYVRIEITGSFSDSFQAFIVPQGGDPDDDNHRIHLTRDATSQDDQIWIGTNVDEITTEYFGSGNAILYADGHAALYLEEDGSVVGADFTSPSDGGRIATAAQEGRHFIIDTIPPIMTVNGSPNADSFIEFDETLNYPTVISFNGGFLPTNVSTITHPYNGIPGGSASFTQFQLTQQAPIDEGVIEDTPLDNPRGAQKFFNVASISNELTVASGIPLAENNLLFSVNVEFLDQNIYDALGVSAGDSSLNGNRFDGDNTDRTVAGFGDTPPPFTGDENTALLFDGEPLSTTDTRTSPRFLARWVLQPGSTRLPEIADDILVTYTSSGSAFGNSNLAAVKDRMTATWDFTTTGIDPDDVDELMHLAVKFAASDRATAYFPKGDKTENIQLIVTEDDRRLDPLHLWWMREVNTEFVRNNVPANGVTQNPSFTWSLASAPRPVVTETAGGTELAPAYTYKIWRTFISQDKDEYRDGPYNQIFEDWTDWDSNSSLDLNLANLEISEAIINPSDPSPTDRWYLLVIQGTDEAGNAELFPDELNDIISGIGDGIPGNSGPNWQRFYVPAVAETIETEVTPLFWHNTDTFPLTLTFFDLDNPESPKSGELNFGSETVIPLPPASVFFPAANTPTINFVNQRVEARFNMRVLSNNTTQNNTIIFWELSSEGNIIAGNTSSTNLIDLFFNQTFAPLVYPGTTDKNIFLGDGNRVRAVSYLFRAWAAIITDPLNPLNSIVTQDSTPASIRFVVVPDVAEYVRNRQTEDEQPIKEFDRP